MSILLAPGATVLEDYKLHRFLGEGGYGEVWEASAPGGVPKAVKIARLNDPEDESANRELQGLRRMRAIRHPYLLSVERYDVVGDSLFVVMELAERTLIERYNQCIDEEKPGIPRKELLQYMREAAEALDLLANKHNLQHLDVKPGNLFLAGGHVKVGDFGLVQPTNTQIPQTSLAFSPPYAPPELFDGRVEPTADQYSLAVTYQELLTGTRPYAAPDVRNLIIQHLRGKPDLSFLPPSDRTIVAKALDRDPSDRFISCRQFVDRLERASGIASATVQGTPGANGVGRPASPVLVSHKGPGPERKRAKTLILGSTTTRSREIGREVSVDCFVETFLAYLPLEIYAHKLRGFIDDLGADLVSCTDEKAVMQISGRNWLGFKRKGGVFVQVDACCRTPESGYRAVEVEVWSVDGKLAEAELARRARKVVQVLRGYLMASDKKRPVARANDLRNELLK